MDDHQPQQAVQETVQSRRGQLVSITNRTPIADSSGKLVSSTYKVPQVMDSAEIVITSSAVIGKEIEKLVEEGRAQPLQMINSLVAHQQFVQSDQNDTEELPKLEPVQESSACAHKMPPFSF